MDATISHGSGFDLEAGSLSKEVRTGFNRLRAGLFRHIEKVWMFDNEIDWVNAIGNPEYLP